MKSGFLTLITHSKHPGLVRAQIRDKTPELKPEVDGGEIRYVARFQDAEAALMHVQNAMHSALVDLENRVYRKPLTEMIACVESDELDHQRVWLDPALPADALEQIKKRVSQRRLSHRRVNRIWQIVGLLGLLLLLLNSL